MKVIVINKGSQEKQLRGHNGKTIEDKKFEYNPGGAMIVIHEDTPHGKISTTRHLKFRHGIWSDCFGNKYDLK